MLILHSCFCVRPMERKILFSCFLDIWLESVVLIRLITPKRNTSHENTSILPNATRSSDFIYSIRIFISSKARLLWLATIFFKPAFTVSVFFGSLTILHEKSNEVISGCSSWNNTSGANATAPLIPNFPCPVYMPEPNAHVR